jgi:hypothetical protein
MSYFDEPPTPRQRRWLITGFYLGLSVAFTALQWAMFSANCAFGIFGMPVLAVWCLIAHLGSVPTPVHRVVAITIGTLVSYSPMLATCAGVKMAPG